MSAVAMESNGWPKVDLPRGAIVKIVDNPLEDEWFVKVQWKDKILRMLKIDLRDRCTLVKKTESAGAAASNAR
jgi:hypothetical protein